MEVEFERISSMMEWCLVQNPGKKYILGFNIPVGDHSIVGLFGGTPPQLFAFCTALRNLAEQDAGHLTVEGK